ncbi:hypothetical protein HPB51_003640 [Rhipicephalus microplus]|uniref:Uncharacterized protein n=1 Tax=Rhipicephalus microplus TaxID=6941 RepID=A0A9J6DYM2_RHIMP|nr:hypothetical protein HPB51_003640 [Rhipicephalus microplus]
MDLFAQRISDPSQLDYCPADDFVREVPEPRLVDVVAARLRDASLNQLLGWAISLVLAVIALVCVVCKVYSRLTLGRCTSNKDLTGRTVIITGANTGKLKASAPSRIITLSSLLHHFGRIDPGHLDYGEYRVPMQVYSDTKLANVLFTKELARRLLGTGRSANVLHPGAVQTDINSTYVGLMNIVMNALFYFFGKTPKEGAQTSIYLTVSDEVAKVTGQYFMDCRRALPSKIAEDPTLARRLWEVSEKLTGLSL